MIRLDCSKLSNLKYNQATMRDQLYPFIKQEKREFILETEQVERRYTGFKKTYTVVVSSLYGMNGGKKFLIDQLDTGIVDTWNSLDRILLEIEPYLNDFKKYNWEEIKKPFIEYWQAKQEAYIKKQKNEGALTIWTPSGDYTLWRSAEFITNILLSKFIALRNNKLLITEDLEEGVEKRFTSLVLFPIQIYKKIEEIVEGKDTESIMVNKIIDTIISFSRSSEGRSENLLDPDYKDEIKFLTEGEQRELNALWIIYIEFEDQIKLNKSLSETEKHIQINKFYDSPNGKRLGSLNSRRSMGGTLTFQEKERRKQLRVIEISEEIEDILVSWGFSSEEVKKGLDYYQLLFTRESSSRWEKEKNYKEMIKKSNETTETSYKALQGIWKENVLKKKYLPLN